MPLSIKLFTLLSFLLLNCNLLLAEDRVDVTDYKVEFDVHNIVKSILVLKNPKTGLSPSHWNHPGYDKLAFIYDKAVDALALKACGYQAEAEKILDYFMSRLTISKNEIIRRSDTNNVYGILNLFKLKESSPESVGLVNAVDITSFRRQGRGRLEFWTTPGPISFMIFAMLKVNANKYKDIALTLGEVLLSMQDKTGAIYDGDRAPDKVHTEPHMDAYAAFLMLYQISEQAKWLKAADKAYSWFKLNVYSPQEGAIDQGVWFNSPNKIFAEDVYSWTMAGPAGDKISLSALSKLTENMLNNSLVNISLSLPDARSIEAILCDFSNPEIEEVKIVRGGFHPLGSVEWTGGAILALQKNAVRFYNAGDAKTARFYKAIAEILLDNVIKCFYFLEELQGKITFYATGQGIEIAPFGSISRELTSGWKTPYFYVQNTDGTVNIKGGSLVGVWPLLPYSGFNPFILNDNYYDTYKLISLTNEDREEAGYCISNIVKNRYFREVIPESAPLASTQIVEPELFNREMWLAFERGYSARDNQSSEVARMYFEEALKWAELVIKDDKWLKLAKRDNSQKGEEFGGIIWYPWNQVYSENNHPLHDAILRYPLLNEVGAAMWGLATANFELGNLDKSKYWIRRMIEEVPLHQIAAVTDKETEEGNYLISGYWNALISWGENPGDYARDAQMNTIYAEVAKEKGFSTEQLKRIYIFDSLLKN